MKSEITIKRNQNKDLMMLKVLSTLLHYGADFKASEIPFYMDKYENEDQISIKANEECIEKSSKYFDEIGIKYTIVKVH
ncbi:hypothetical protein J2X31_002518 [Flavobacterium arsenatis]|uniref:Uncharacterized protein n=1 Tax=Flavobacterium arsenatis TaxID=1484332 RepID=A0ABU1TRK2_9FLAO|nr:hypothetical protein [Flavobacterium arsenatis]MDR6968495.1 hypothetical protein [Flavobacterium arsenatis]